jgi:hypothetical protein
MGLMLMQQIFIRHFIEFQSTISVTKYVNDFVMHTYVYGEKDSKIN